MYRIAEWEQAIRRRTDVRFDEIYLKNGLVEVVIGIVQIPYRRGPGPVHTRDKKVRWNRYGICLNIKGTSAENLDDFNIQFKH